MEVLANAMGVIVLQVYQVNALYTLNLPSIISQLYLIKAGLGEGHGGEDP